jgi:hypothetical protein
VGKCEVHLSTDDIHVESDMWCSLEQDSLVLPFWLKAVNFSKSQSLNSPMWRVAPNAALAVDGAESP